MNKQPRLLDVPARDAVSTAQPTESLRDFVRRQLLDQLARQWAVGTRLPPIRQLAEQYGVAIGTVQSAIRDLVNAGVLTSRPTTGTVVARSCSADRVRALLTEGLFEQRRERETNLTGKRVQIFHLTDLDRPTEAMAHQLVQSMQKHGCEVERLPCNNSVPIALHAPGADAVVVIQPSHRLDPRLEAHQVLLVIATERIDVNATGRYDLITVDDDHGSFLAGRRLKEAGCQHACFIGARDRRTSLTALHVTSRRRLHGFERGWGDEVAPDRQLAAGSYDIGPSEHLVPAFLALSPRPDAVFAATDELAVGFIQGVRKHGLEPGRDFHIIGFDKQELALTLPGGPLTTIEVPRIQMAVRGAQTLVERLNDPDQPIRRVYLGCSLFEGSTTGRM